jgi:uncharacterized phage protein (TIGR01671 family)
MREIKFRAWHKEYKKMLTVYVIHQGTYSEGFVRNCQGFVPPNDQYIFKFNEAEWMQYTGLKDKNGKEIYEGDILESSAGGYKYAVEFKNGCFMWCDEPIVFDGDRDKEDNFSFGSDWATVIGNIYENPNLL